MIPVFRLLLHKQRIKLPECPQIFECHLIRWLVVERTEKVVGEIDHLMFNHLKMVFRVHRESVKIVRMVLAEKAGRSLQSQGNEARGLSKRYLAQKAIPAG
jgi:hypothetical protein